MPPEHQHPDEACKNWFEAAMAKYQRETVEEIGKASTSVQLLTASSQELLERQLELIQQNQERIQQTDRVLRGPDGTGGLALLAHDMDLRVKAIEGDREEYRQCLRDIKRSIGGLVWKVVVGLVTIAASVAVFIYRTEAHMGDQQIHRQVVPSSEVHSANKVVLR